MTRIEKEENREQEITKANEMFKAGFISKKERYVYFCKSCQIKYSENELGESAKA